MTPADHANTVRDMLAELERLLNDLWEQFAYTDSTGKKYSGGLSTLEALEAFDVEVFTERVDALVAQAETAEAALRAADQNAVSLQIWAENNRKRAETAEAERDTAVQQRDALQAEKDSQGVYVSFEAAEALRAERDAAKALALERADALFAAQDERDAAVQTAEQAQAALRIVRGWIRDGKGTESEAAEAMDAALAGNQP